MSRTPSDIAGSDLARLRGMGRLRGTGLVIGLSLLLVGGSLGCQLFGAAAYVLQPPAKSEAKYKPSTRPMAVFVDAERQGGNAGLVRDSIAGFLVMQLQEHKVADVQPVHKIYDLRMKNPRAFRSMKVDEVGKVVGAEQVLYVDLVNADVMSSTGGQLIRGSIMAYVRIVDVPTGRTLWPENLNDGYPVQVDSPFATGNESNIDAMREQMSRTAADAIAKLFYTYSLE